MSETTFKSMGMRMMRIPSMQQAWCLNPTYSQASHFDATCLPLHSIQKEAAPCNFALWYCARLGS